MNKFWKNKLGYTLGEIVMTTAIIGSLAAIAVPNYMRIKMNVNMEMVKQHLRILGQNMNELYNQNNPHQYPEDILNLDGNPAEELSITASLNAINGMGYGITHRTAAGGTDFSDRADPMPGMFGVAGDGCLIVDSSGVVREIDCSSGEGIDMFILDESLISVDLFSSLFSDPTLSDAERISILSGMFIQLGLYVDWLNDPFNFEIYMNGSLPNYDGLPGLFAPMNAQDKPAFDQLFDKVFDRLKENGIQIYLNYEESHPRMYVYGGETKDEMDFQLTSGLSFAVEFNSENPYEMISASQTAFADVKAFMEYASKSPIMEDGARRQSQDAMLTQLFGQLSADKR